MSDNGASKVVIGKVSGHDFSVNRFSRVVAVDQKHPHGHIDSQTVEALLLLEILEALRVRNERPSDPPISPPHPKEPGAETKSPLSPGRSRMAVFLGLSPDPDHWPLVVLDALLTLESERGMGALLHELRLFTQRRPP